MTALICGDMKTNGTLSYQILSAGGVNELGEPLPVQSKWSTPEPCLIKTNTDNRKGVYEDGEFRLASFTVVLELKDLPDFGRIKLTRYSEELGEYRIMTREPFPNFGRIQIMV